MAENLRFKTIQKKGIQKMSKNKPNIVFILSDQHNAKLLGCKQHPYVKTPYLDKMASNGVRFDNAITQNPICTPSRISYISGQYPHNHGYYGNSGPNPEGLPTLMGHFRNHGYATAAVGKIHCPEYWVEDDCDTYIEVSGACSIGGGPEYHRYLEEEKVKETFDKEQYKSPWGGQSCDGIPSKLDYKYSREGFTISESLKFMKKASQEQKPFCIHVSLPKPHQFYTPTQEFWDLYEGMELELPPNADYDMTGKAPHLIAKEKKWRGGGWESFEPKTYEAARMRKYRAYIGCVSQVDYAVGQILEWLEQNGLEENTIVVYTSDHGDNACEHGIMEKAPGICTDAVTRIPAIWQWKGHLKEGHVASEIVETVDVSATLCSLAGIDRMETSDGKDITPLLQGEEKTIHSIGVTEFAWSKSVRKGNFRYIYYPREMFRAEYPDGFGELYNLEEDPWEMKNLYFEEKYTKIVQEMQRDLMEWMVMTTRNKTLMGIRENAGKQWKRRYKNDVLKDGKLPPIQLRDMKTIEYL